MTIKIINGFSHLYISIHTALTDSDFNPDVQISINKISIHTALTDSDSPPVDMALTALISIHTALTDSDSKNAQ